MLSAPPVTPRFGVDHATARGLTEAFGTPLYVLDEVTLRARIRAYRQAFQDAYAESEIAYASKANSTLAVLAIAASEGCRIDVASEGELCAARSAGVPADNCHFHGNNKSHDELAAALGQGIGQIVIDNFGEIEALSAVWPPKSATKLLLRLAPGVDPITHALISTGQADTKFGFSIADGSAERAVLRCLGLGLPLVGFHCHVGSQLLDPEAQRMGGEALARFAVEMKRRHGFSASYLNVGGGLGARYTDEDRPMDVESYCRLIVKTITDALAGSGLGPTLAQEPGRSLVAEAGVTLYRVGVVKPTSARTYVCVDGGLSDNPRPALYGARYDIALASRASNAELAPVRVVGRHCESDPLIDRALLPADVREGDVVQIFATGAYNASMSSNYNRYSRPATVLIRADGRHCLVQRRETFDEMLAREIVPSDLLGKDSV
jgi:diaminopimelate decarboxylase